MHALVSTVNYLLIVNLDDGATSIVENNRPEYYGISWHPGSDDLVLTHSGIDNAMLTDITSYATSEVGYVSYGSNRSPAFLSAPHQLLCGSDGRIIVTNTGRNRVNVFDPAKPNIIQEVGISDRRWDRLTNDQFEGDHLNSVFERNGILLIVAHRFKAGSKLARFTYPECELISIDEIPDATGIHNALVDENGFEIGCHSELGGLIDLRSGEVLWRVNQHAYTRGLAATKDDFYVGASAITSRNNRASCNADIWIVDRKTMLPRDYFALGPFGAVHEIRLIDVPDLGHHGSPLLNGLKTIRERQHQDRAKITRDETIIAHSITRYWRPFRDLIGSAESLDDGWRVVESFLLSILNRASTKVACDYRLHDAGSSYVSLVAGYEGSGKDAEMDAYLLAAMQGEAVLQVWHNRSGDWVLNDAVSKNGLPFSGNLELRVRDGRADVLVDGSIVISQFPTRASSAPNSRLGLRACNATIRPSEIRTLTISSSNSSG